jgi:hypothetical protein
MSINLIQMLVETRSVAHEIIFTGSKSQKIRHRARMSIEGRPFDPENRVQKTGSRFVAISVGLDFGLYTILNPCQSGIKFLDTPQKTV